MGLRPMEIILILVVLLLLFGATRLPQLGTSLGSAIRNFKKGFSGTEEDKGGDGGKNVVSLSSSSTAEAKDAGKVAEKQG